MKYSRLSIFLFGFVCAIALLFSVRGLPGNPTAQELVTPVWKDHGPLELSPERGRFALLYSVVEDRSLFFSLPVARLATPDLARNPDGKFVSLFAPLLSFLLIPGYLIGKFFGASVVGATLVVAIAAFANAFLIRAIALRLGAGKNAASLGALTFLLATPAFPYATTLYQHHFSVLFLLSAILLLLSNRGFLSLALVFFLLVSGIALDNPNAILFLPVGLWALSRILSFRTSDTESVRVSFRPLLLFSGFFAVIPLLFFLWYNSLANGNPFTLSGTLPSVAAISSDGSPLSTDPNQIPRDRLEREASEKTAVGFFQTRALLNGFLIHLTSPDRGALWFTPVIFLGFFGFAVLFVRKEYGILRVLLGTSLLTFLLYSLWSDPWGGWAFGSRYLIPAYAMLSIGIAIALESRKRSFIFLAAFFLLFSFSLSVNTLGAITSIANPPKVQVLELEALSGKEQKYTVMRNWQALEQNTSTAFLYRSVLHRFFGAIPYGVSLFIFVVVSAFLFLYALLRESSFPSRRV